MSRSPTARLRRRRRAPPSGGAGFLFKGSGFYITDYRSDSYKQGGRGGQAAAKGSDTATGADAGPAKPTREEGSAAPKWYWRRGTSAKSE
jgi:hypothetical protein